MIKVEDKIISLDVFEKHFLCDLNSCKGACCVEGDSGAPVTPKEREILEEIYPHIKPYMRKEGIEEVEKNSVAVYDMEGDLTTSLVNNKECVFVIFENNVAKCAIEKAYQEKKINFKKPISCHLFPVRITEYEEFDAVNYEELKICKSACDCGLNEKVYLYKFLKQALIRKYSISWYKKLLEAAKLLGI